LTRPGRFRWAALPVASNVSIVSIVSIVSVVSVVSCGQPVLSPDRFEYQTAEQLEAADAVAADVALSDSGVPDTFKSDTATPPQDTGPADSTGTDTAKTDSADAATPPVDTAIDGAKQPDVQHQDSTSDSLDTKASVDSGLTSKCSDPGSSDPCDDGNVCTIGDHCQGGLCLPGEVTPCDDGSGCTKDSCHPQSGCVFSAAGADGLACDADGSPCTVNDSCDKGACLPGPATSCSDANPCTDDACDKKTGACSHTAGQAGKACDDADPCTTSDSCAAGTCLPGQAANCDDANACTKDACEAPTASTAGGCIHLVAAGPCTDSGPCTLQASCLDGSCIVTHGGVPPSCDDNNTCTKEACSAKKGCIHLPVAGACDDGDACSDKDACSAGKCAGKPRPPGACEDGNPCTKDACDKAKGCGHTALAGACDDGDKCTSADACKAGACIGLPAAATLCDDKNLCTEDACDAKAGCVHAATHGSCDDGNLCTSNDRCKANTCAGEPVPAAACDDNNPCSKDACLPATGCTHTDDDAAACDDGDACTSPDRCASGGCVGAPVDATKTCADGNTCTADSCPTGKGAKGCVHLPVAATCDDANACTGNDRCSGAVCVGTADDKAKLCDDANPCTRDRCDSAAAPGKSCKHDPLTGAACDDADKCTENDACAAGKCAGLPLDVTASCNDANACTADACAADKGCIHPHRSGPCDDAEPCSENDKCGAGTCIAGPQRSCDDGNSCTLDTCIKDKGCNHSFHGGACDDGDKCTASDVCVFGRCRGAVRSCDDANDCTADSCDKAVGCLASAVSATCDDANPCTTSDACAAGSCKGKALADGAPCQDALPCRIGAKCTAAVCMASAVTADGTPCDDGNHCTESDACAKGSCRGAPRVCDDGDTCTLDACNPALPASKGCTHTATKAALKCIDGSACSRSECDRKTGKCATTNTCATRLVYSEGFDCGGNNGFSLAPSAAEPEVAWHIDGTPAKPAPKNGGCTLNFNDGKDYANGKRVQGIATSPPIALPHAPTPVLRLWSYHGVELNKGYDIRTIEVSAGGFGMDTQRVRLANSSNPGAWTRVVVPLAQWRRKVIRVRFRFDSVDGSSNTGPGWFIDGLQVEATMGGGSCQGRCGAYRPEAACQCDPICALHGDCCADLVPVCGGCAAASDCKGADQCATAGCRQASGRCAFSTRPDGAGCDDSDACTPNDTCHGGFCTGVPLACDDGNGCTSDRCDPKSGKCAFTPLAAGAGCDDGDACTGLDKCAKSGCKGTPINCDDGNACTANTCSSKVGCTIKLLTSACEDGSKCTAGDKCSGGACVAGKALVCDDGNPCTLDICDGKSGSCQLTPRPAGTPCPGGTCIDGKCAAGGTCGNGKLEGGEQCDDGGTKDGDGCSAKCALEAPAGMVLVPAGPFWMGCKDGATTCHAAELPQHKVNLSAFWIDRDEVAVQRYLACIKSGACSAPNKFNVAFATLAKCNYERPGAGQHPINCLSQQQAAAFCKWAGGRLPTEAEWEKAAIGGCETLPGKDCKAAARRFPWGDTAADCARAVLLVGPDGCAGGFTAPVGGRLKGASPYGARDMVGNVAEWTSDWYAKDYYAKSPPADPKGPATATGQHAFRGGAFTYAASVVRAAMRFNFAVPHHRDARVGVRCVRDVKTGP